MQGRVVQRIPVDTSHFASGWRFQQQQRYLYFGEGRARGICRNAYRRYDLCAAHVLQTVGVRHGILQHPKPFVLPRQAGQHTWRAEELRRHFNRHPQVTIELLPPRLSLLAACNLPRARPPILGLSLRLSYLHFLSLHLLPLQIAMT